MNRMPRIIIYVRRLRWKLGSFANKIEEIFLSMDETVMAIFIVSYFLACTRY
jgi:hypothetical protein